MYGKEVITTIRSEMCMIPSILQRGGMFDSNCVGGVARGARNERAC